MNQFAIEVWREGKKKLMKHGQNIKDYECYSMADEFESFSDPNKVNRT